MYLIYNYKLIAGSSGSMFLWIKNHAKMKCMSEFGINNLNSKLTSFDSLFESDIIFQF